jgi:hypothetical protein
MHTTYLVNLIPHNFTVLIILSGEKKQQLLLFLSQWWSTPLPAVKYGEIALKCHCCFLPENFQFLIYGLSFDTT